MRKVITTVHLPHERRKSYRVCVIGDSEHVEEALKLEEIVDVADLEYLKKFNKDKNLIKKWAKKYDFFVCSISLIKLIPRILGTGLNRVKKFPSCINHELPLLKQIQDESRRVRWYIGRRVNLDSVIGNVSLTEKQIQENVRAVLKHLSDQIKNSFYMIKTIYIKTSMGKPIQLK